MVFVDSVAVCPLPLRAMAKRRKGFWVHPLVSQRVPKGPTRCNRCFYCRSYCLLNIFRTPLCPSSGAQDYYTVVAACGIWCCGFQVGGLVWNWGLCLRFAGCCSILQTGAGQIYFRFFFYPLPWCHRLLQLKFFLKIIANISLFAFKCDLILTVHRR